MGDWPQTVTSLTGTANQITVNTSYGDITISTPQSIAIASTPQFARLGLGAAADATALLLLSSASSPYLDITDTTTPATLRLQTADTTATIGTTTNHLLQFITNNSNVMSLSAAGSLKVDSAGPHAFGVATVADTQFKIAGTFTATNLSNNDMVIDVFSTLNMVASDSLEGFRYRPTIVKAASGTHATFALFDIAPTISNTNSTTTVTDAFGLRIQSIDFIAGTSSATGLDVSAPKNASTNYAASFRRSDGTLIAQFFGTGGIGFAGAADPGANIVAFGSGVTFAGITTTASAANAYLDNAASNNLLRSTSSWRYKTNWRSLTSNDYITLLKFKPGFFNSLAIADDPKKDFVGFLAEDLAAVAPIFITWKPAIEITDADYRGKYKKEQLIQNINGIEMVPDAISYDRIVPYLVGIIQDLYADVVAVKAILKI